MTTQGQVHSIHDQTWIQNEMYLTQPGLLSDLQMPVSVKWFWREIKLELYCYIHLECITKWRHEMKIIFFNLGANSVVDNRDALKQEKELKWCPWVLEVCNATVNISSAKNVRSRLLHINMFLSRGEYRKRSRWTNLLFKSPWTFNPTRLECRGKKVYSPEVVTGRAHGRNESDLYGNLMCTTTGRD